ncbi:MAG: riboflavin synthase [Verrucomicrobiota bacterium]|nr:riboflavin synthase [Verrucomicrobiota bacterium]
MFTGLVEEAGSIASIEHHAKGIRLAVHCKIVQRGTRKGDSIAVNGCCLTVVGIKRGHQPLLMFDLLHETWDRTSFAKLKAGARVNLERALQLKDRFGGHFVTGHVDGTGMIESFAQTGTDWRLEVIANPEVQQYLVPKGAITVDGVSLTVAEVKKKGFVIWIIPHTYRVTALGDRKPGDPVNLESDLLGKYVGGLLQFR